MPQEVAKKLTDFGLPDVRIMQAEIQTHSLPGCTHGETGDRRNAPVALQMRHGGCVASRRPCSSDRRDQQEPRFIDKYDMGTHPCGFFLMLGHWVRFHSSMTSSLRWLARRSGFWYVHSTKAMTRPMWSRWYRTPKCFSMTSAIRAVVHKSVRYPFAKGPFSSSSSSRTSCLSVSLRGRPEAGLGFSPPPGSASRALRQRITELAWLPTRLATSLRENPWSRSSHGPTPSGFE